MKRFFFKVLKSFDFYNSRGTTQDQFRGALKHLAHTSFYSNERYVNHNLSKDELEALKGLSNIDDLVVLRPDKDNGVVILNKSDYINKMNVILIDNSKFKKVNDDVLIQILNRKEKINRFLRQLKS